MTLPISHQNPSISPIQDATQDLPREEYFTPGSTLRARFDNTHPLAYGMPPEALLLNWSSPVFEINSTALNEKIVAPITYPQSDLLKIGWLIGEEHITSKAAALDISYGDGRMILLGFRPQHRAQTHGTFKVFFNALHYGSAEDRKAIEKLD